eukprot:5173367-Alexandrium_andersonii.AAC.1
MSASLVGSEMCIRDRPEAADRGELHQPAAAEPQPSDQRSRGSAYGGAVWVHGRRPQPSWSVACVCRHGGHWGRQ